MNAERERQMEKLNAWLDGELDAEARAELDRRLETDAVLRARLAELQATRYLVQYALHNACPPAPPAGWRRRGIAVLGRAVAALLLIGVGVALGWALNPARPGTPLTAYLPDGAVAIQPAGTAHTADTRAIIHLSSADLARVSATLDEAERLLREFAVAKRRLELEIIANEEGLGAFRADIASPARARIEALLTTYDNLRFLACGKTLERFRREHGARVTLIPAVQVVPSALDQIILRLKDGWTYIRA
jgi:intracellular sulfur oxidation DsrE/DsrF family protein